MEAKKTHLQSKNKLSQSNAFFSKKLGHVVRPAFMILLGAMYALYCIVKGFLRRNEEFVVVNETF